MVDFVEKEKPWQLEITTKDLYYKYKTSYHNDIDRAVNEVKEYLEIKELYKWYKESFDLNSSYEGHKGYEFQTNQLVRLVKLRKHYWT